MRLFKILPTVFLLAILVNFTGFAQQDSIVLNNIISKTKQIAEEQPLEKAVSYTHLDVYKRQAKYPHSEILLA